MDRSQPSGTPSSREFFERIDRALADDRERRRRTGIVVVELDPLTLGPELEAELLSRLRATARDADVVGRLAEHRFVVLVGGLKEIDALAQLIVRITANLRGPVEVLGRTVYSNVVVSGAISDARSTSWSLVEAALPHSHRASA